MESTSTESQNSYLQWTVFPCSKDSSVHSWLISWLTPAPLTRYFHWWIMAPYTNWTIDNKFNHTNSTTRPEYIQGKAAFQTGMATFFLNLLSTHIRKMLHVLFDNNTSPCHDSNANIETIVCYLYITLLNWRKIDITVIRDSDFPIMGAVTPINQSTSQPWRQTVKMRHYIIQSSHDLDIWPLTLKTFSAVPLTRLMFVPSFAK